MTLGADNERHPAVLQVEYPERCSRLLALLGALFFVKAILLIPHIIIIMLLGIALPQADIIGEGRLGGVHRATVG